MSTHIAAALVMMTGTVCTAVCLINKAPASGSATLLVASTLISFALIAKRP